jgi:histidinol-phosphate aminotransferase
MMQKYFFHGGPDAQGCPTWDFSTNANAYGPCPDVVAMLAAADVTHYPDPGYVQLREQLAQWHGVATGRVLLAGSASEFIFRLTGWAQRQGVLQALLPQHSYGDYARAALACGMGIATYCASDGSHTDDINPTGRALTWCCDPDSPHGQIDRSWISARPQALLVLDMAYAPLILGPKGSTATSTLDKVWQLWTPNKALGLTGVRAAYAIGPVGAELETAQLNALCPSWPVGSHGVAMLSAWTSLPVQSWLAASLITLHTWKLRQIAICESLGWDCQPSATNFYVARPSAALSTETLAALRTRGVKLRDCTSFGLAGHLRLSVQPPPAQDALVQALRQRKI